jgi:hypothetical protein
MRYSGFIAAAAALALGVASLPAHAASERHHRGASARGAAASDNMADDLNSRSLSRAQAGQDAMSGSSGGGMMGSGTGMSGGSGMMGGGTGMSGGSGMGSSGYGSGMSGSSMGSSMGAPGMSGGGGTGSSGPVGTGRGMR